MCDVDTSELEEYREPRATLPVAGPAPDRATSPRILEVVASAPVALAP
jgi:hypothetical protein